MVKKQWLDPHLPIHLPQQPTALAKADNNIVTGWHVKNPYEILQEQELL